MGWGEFSDTMEIAAAKVPDQPNPPTTSINNIFVRIAWEDPYLNSSPVISYRLFVANKDGAFAEELTYCSGD